MGDMGDEIAKSIVIGCLKIAAIIVIIIGVIAGLIYII